MTTAFEYNRAKWQAACDEALSEWGKWRRYSKAVNFVIKFVPGMLAQIDADTQTIERQYSNRGLASAACDLLEALEMVRDADDDCKRDGLSTIPPIARAKIDKALAKAREVA